MGSWVHGLPPTAQLEITPFEGLEMEIAASLSPGTSVVVNPSPTLGLDWTVRFAADLRSMGYRPILVLEAHRVPSAQLSELVVTMARAGIRDLIVTSGAGAREPGCFEHPLPLLEALDVLGFPADSLGVEGYPAGRAPWLESPSNAELHREQQYASYVVTRLCLDPHAIARWVDGIRCVEIRLPVVVGIPGAIFRPTLLGMAMRAGVQNAARSLRRPRAVRHGQLRRDRFDSRSFASQVLAAVADRGRPISGLHVFTCNDLASTRMWRREAKENRDELRWLDPARSGLRLVSDAPLTAMPRVHATDAEPGCA